MIQTSIKDIVFIEDEGTYVNTVSGAILTPDEYYDQLEIVSHDMKTVNLPKFSYENLIEKTLELALTDYVIPVVTPETIIGDTKPYTAKGPQEYICLGNPRNPRTIQFQLGQKEPNCVEIEHKTDLRTSKPWGNLTPKGQKFYKDFLQTIATLLINCKNEMLDGSWPDPRLHMIAEKILAIVSGVDLVRETGNLESLNTEILRLKRLLKQQENNFRNTVNQIYARQDRLQSLFNRVTREANAYKTMIDKEYIGFNTSAEQSLYDRSVEIAIYKLLNTKPQGDCIRHFFPIKKGL